MDMHTATEMAYKNGYFRGAKEVREETTWVELNGEIVCEKGLFASKQLESLFKKMVTDPHQRGTITIELLDKGGKVARKWTLSEVWCTSH